MSFRTVRMSAAGLLFPGAFLMLAQSPEPSHILRIYRESIKSGRSVAHEKGEAGYVRAFSKSKYPNYIALQSMTGGTEAWFLERYETYAELDEAIKIADTQPLKSALELLDGQDGELRTTERGIIAIYEKDLSYLPVPSDVAHSRFFSINTTRIRPGHATDFAEMRKILNAAFEKSGSKQRRVVYRVASGAPSGIYLILAAMPALKSMDPNAGGMSMTNAFAADNLARYDKLAADLVVSSEAALFSVNPRMSYPSKEFITADPQFWAPKPPAPKPPAPAAPKSAGGQ